MPETEPLKQLRAAISDLPALRELTGEGWLVRMQGGGTFVAELKGHTVMLGVRSIAGEIVARGPQPPVTAIT